MKRTLIIALLALPLLINPVSSQEVYQMSSWESLFQFADVKLVHDFPGVPNLLAGHAPRQGAMDAHARQVSGDDNIESAGRCPKTRLQVVEHDTDM